MKCKRLFALLTAGVMTAALPQVSLLADVTAVAEDKTAADYSYTVTPIFEPFNEYFYVKTDNPDLSSIRFVDKSTKYTDDEATVRPVSERFADVVYDDTKTGRVNGGYIFSGWGIDGGELVLQEYKYVLEGDYWTPEWVDTDVTVTLPACQSMVDYLIDTYATKNSFFDNMDAVQSALRTICFYSGSYIRGEIYRQSDFWRFTTYTHVDQLFYILSPYSRKNNKQLLAVYLYPFFGDSLGFPSIMSSVAKSLDSSAIVNWSETSHAHINVTYGGETKTYGGQGIGKGQDISEKDIAARFDLANGKANMTLEQLQTLINGYMNIELEDDIPREDELTWKMICDKVGSEGAWIRTVGGIYTFVYAINGGELFWANEWGVGNSILWGGDFGYCKDTWVDGRYVDKWERYIPGAKFEDHPTADLILKDYSFPVVTCQKTYKGYDKEKGKNIYEYSDVSVSYRKMNVPFFYNSTDKVWKADSSVYSDLGYSYYDDVAAMTEQGLLDNSVMNAMRLTEDYVKTLGVDRNTDTVPHSGYIYDGTAEPGTPFEYKKGDVNCDGKVDIMDVLLIRQHLAGWAVNIDPVNADYNGDNSISILDVLLIRQHLAGWAV